MSGPKGWCPSVYAPMEVEDGLLARLRPHLSRLTAEQVVGLCALAYEHGNGLLELTNRASLQIRGLSEATHPSFLEGMNALGLLDEDLATETRRSILVEPFWQPGTDTELVANSFLKRLGDLPDLPAKFGFVIDLGDTPVLQDVSGDVRIERCEGGFLVRADGAPKGKRVELATCIDAAIELSAWFAERRTNERRRMAQVVAHDGPPVGWADAPPLPQGTGLEARDLGQMVAFPATPFPAAMLRRAVETSHADALRLTPCRQIVLEAPAVELPPQFAEDAVLEAN